MSAGRVTVVVCAYTEERWDAICAALASVAAQDRPPAETVLVVDHNDALLSRARAAFEPGVHVVASTGTPGLSGARNTGVEVATGDVVAFLDDDAVAEPDWLARLCGPYEDPAVMGTGGRAVPVWPGGGRRPYWLPEEFDWVVGCSYTGQPQATTDVRNFLGANMSFRREAFRIAGGFSDTVGRVGTRPVGCEETEFCIRLRQRRPGTRLLYEPTAVVHHHVSAPRTRWRYFRSRCYSEGLSKALVSRMVGAQDGLSAERSYVSSVLPRAVVTALLEALRLRQPRRVVLAANVVIGLAATTTGYASTRARTRDGRTGRHPDPGTAQVHPVLRRLFGSLDADDVAWCLLRGERSLARPTGDVDLLVAGDDLSRAEEVILAQGFVVLPRRHGTWHRFYGMRDPSSGAWLRLDVVARLRYRGVEQPSRPLESGCLARRRAVDGVNRLTETDQFWTVALHCIFDKGAVTPRRAAELVASAPHIERSSEVEAFLAATCGAEAPDAVLAAVARCDWPALVSVARDSAGAPPVPGGSTSRGRSLTLRLASRGYPAIWRSLGMGRTPLAAEVVESAQVDAAVVRIQRRPLVNAVELLVRDDEAPRLAHALGHRGFRRLGGGWWRARRGGLERVSLTSVSRLATPFAAGEVFASARPMLGRAHWLAAAPSTRLLFATQTSTAEQTTPPARTVRPDGWDSLDELSAASWERAGASEPRQRAISHPEPPRPDAPQRRAGAS